MEELHIKIGKKLNRIRKTRDLSLDKLAEMTGVSKSMLGQIERGESIPTVTTLWKIANGLRLTFSSFIDEEQPSVSIVNISEINPLKEENGGVRVYPIFPFESNKQFEVYTIELDAGYYHKSDKHNYGVEEYVLVTKGVLDIEIDEKMYTINEGNSVRFVADSIHFYHNKTTDIVRANLIVYYP